MALDPNYGVRVQQYAQDRYPQAFQPGPQIPMPMSGGPSAVGAEPPQPQGPKGFAKLVLDAQGDGPKLDPDTLAALKERYITEQLRPREWAKKGSKEDTVAAIEAAFDSKANRWIEKYLSEATEGAAANEPVADYGVGSALGDFTTQTLGTLLKAPAGIASLADYGIRAGRALIDPELRNRPGIAAKFGAPTALGSWAERVASDIDESVQENMSARGRQASETVFAAHKDKAFMPAVLDTLGAIAENPASLPGLLGQGAGSLGPVALLRIPRIAKAISGLSTTSKALTGATIAGAPLSGASIAAFEADLRKASLEELLQDNPDGWALYDSVSMLYGDSEKAKQVVKDELINKATTAFGAFTLAANVGLAAIPGLRGAEGAVAGATRGGVSRMGNVLRGTASEAGQESLAGVLETGGENIGGNIATGSDTPFLEGAGGSATVGGVVGGLIGGGVGALQGGPRNPLARKRGAGTNQPPAAAGEPTEAAPVPAAASTPPAPAAPTEAPVGLAATTETPGAGIEEGKFDTLNNKLRTSTNQSVAKQTIKQGVAKLDAEGVIANAVRRAQTSAGAEWANLTTEQRLTLVETAVESLRKHNKAEGIPEALIAFRQGLEQTQVTPPGPVETPPNDTGVTPTPAPAPAPAPTPTPTPTPAPQTPAAPASGTETPAPRTEAKLPQGLKGAKPRWGEGTAIYQPNFESDIDKALYIVAGEKKSPSDAKYRAWLVENGVPENRIDELGRLVQQAVAAQMRQTKGGTSIAPARPLMPATNILETIGTPPPDTPTPTPAPTKPAAKKAPAKKAAKKATAKKATTAPKTEAPAATSEPGQTATTARETEEAAVERIAPELEPTDKQELIAAMRLAREGDPIELASALRGMVANADITSEQARAIREAARELTPAEQGLTVPAEPKQAQPWDTGADGTEPWGDSETLVRAVREISKLPTNQRAKPLLEAVLNSEESTRPQKWLANKLLEVISDIEVNTTFHKTGAPGAFTYGTGKHVVNINTVNAEVILHEYVHAVTSAMLRFRVSDARVQAIQQSLQEVRERLQDYIANDSTFRMLGAQTQALIRYAASNNRELVTHVLTNPPVQKYLQRIPSSNPELGASLWDEFRSLLSSFLAKLFNADPVQRSLLDDLLDRSINAVEFAASNPKAVNLLNTRLATREAILPDKVLEDIGAEFTDGMALEVTDKKPPLNVDTRPTTRAGRLIERLAQSAYGIEESMRLVRRSGGTITPENNPYLAQLRYTSDIAENRNFDVKEFVEPIRDWITNNWNSFPLITSVEQFRKELDKFLQAYHALNERNPTVWAETVPLTGDGEVQRAEIMEEARVGDISAADAETRLRQLAERLGTKTLEEWAKASPNAIDPEGARKIIENAARLGLTPESLAEFNGLLDRVRQREHWRRVQAGIVSDTDPFARRPSWKWYVPLKDDRQLAFNLGVLSKRKEFSDRNLKTVRGRQTVASNALESLILDLNTSAAEHAEYGFKSALYEYVTDNLDLLGAKVREFSGTPKFGYTYMARVKIRNNKTGKTRTVWKERHRSDLPNPSSGFVYSNGDTHFIVELPKGSRLDAGIKGIRNTVSPYQIDPAEPVGAGVKFDRAAESQGLLGKGIRGLQTATNILARSYTTWAPDWQLMVGFVRDIQTLPLTIGIDQFKHPWEARAFFTQYFKNLGSNTFQIASTGKEIKAILKNDRSELRKYAEDNPNSYIAENIRFREAGGSTEFAQGLNRERIDDLLFGQAKRQEAGVGIRDLGRGYDKWNQLTSDWAALLENKGRVAAFKAMAEVIAQREHGNSWGQLDPEVQKAVDRQAAAITKGAMDYGQSGEWGKLINAWHAFYRVGATQIDVMRRIFTAPDGGLDMDKVKTWLPFMGAMGVINYMLVAAMLGDDEDGEPRIKKFNPETLTKKMLLPIGDEVYSASIGLGLPQLMLAPGTLAAAYASGHISAEEARDAYYDIWTSSNLPISPAGRKKGSGAIGFINSWMQGILTPTVGDPIAEVSANVNAFDRPIHTEWPQKDKFKSDMKMPHTQQQWADLAKGLRENFGIDMFPEDIKHLVNAYGGQIPKSIQRWTIDKAKREEEGADTSAIRLATRGEVRDEEFYYRNEARKVQAELQTSERLMKSEAGSDKAAQAKWRRQNPDHARRLDAKRTIDRALDAYYKRRNQIRDNTLMTPQGKRDQNKLADSALREAVRKAEQVLENTE